MIECPKCKWTNRDDAVRCANCNGELRAQQQPTQQQPPPQGYAPPPPPQQQYPQQQQQYGQPQYGPQQPYAQYAQSVPDNLAWSIVVTVLCCLPLGIVAIVKAAEANGKKAAGDYYGAMADYEASKTWMYWSLGVGLVTNMLGFAFGLLGAIGGAHHP